jgi:hypothetical protein
MEGTWLASGTVTLPAVTLEGILTVPANQIIQGGAITIARAATPPNPDSLVHIWNASAGAVTALGNTLVTIENNTNCRLSFLTPNFADSGIIFGDPEDNDSSWILYGHSTNNYKVRLNGTERLFYSAGAFAFQEATNITSTATLTLQGNIAQDISLWGTLGTGRTLALIGTDATNGAVNDSPSLVMRAFYDADPTAGVTSTAWNYTILHDMLTAGATPSSSVLHSINSVLGYSMTNNNGTMSHSFVGVVTTGGLTFSASALALNAPNLADGDYFTIGARNSSTDAIVEVARVVGGNTPYIAFGLSQQVLFYNDGSGTLGTGLGFGALNGNAAASIISARNSVDGDYLIFRARDSDTDTLVEVSRVAGASDPYFSMGGSGQFKFYNGGTCDFANPVMFSVGVISALVANQVSLGGYDVGGVDGHRALSWSQEDPIVVAIAAASTHKVPITFNGTTIYLLASNV